MVCLLLGLSFAIGSIFAIGSGHPVGLYALTGISPYPPTPLTQDLLPHSLTRACYSLIMETSYAKHYVSDVHSGVPLW